MKCLIILSAAVALAASSPILLANPNYQHWAAPVVSSQYHAQDELGQYSYGYAGGPSAKHEVKTWDGVTRGGYSYIDANGLVQTVNYIADPVHGFRVAATNLPLGPGSAPAPVVDTPEVAAAKVAHAAAHVAAKVAVPVAAPVVVVAPAPVVDTPEVAAAKAEHLAVHAAAKVAAPVAVVAPAPVAVAAPAVQAPVAIAAPAVHAPLSYAPYAPAFSAYNWGVPVASSQYHAQDELGQYSYGYAGGPSTKHETKTWDGITRGGYSYIDANGIVQTVNYISDPVHGFRVAATNLPLGPGIAPAPVVDTPEVVAARSAHFAAHAEAKARV